MTNEILASPHHRPCCAHPEQSVMMCGKIDNTSQKELQQWLRGVSPVKFSHLVKKESLNYGHVHFSDANAAGEFYYKTRGQKFRCPVGIVQFVAANYYKSKRKVRYPDFYEYQDKPLPTHSPELSDASPAGPLDPLVPLLAASSSATSSSVAISESSVDGASAVKTTDDPAVTATVPSDISTLPSELFLKPVTINNIISSESAISNTIVTQPYALLEDNASGVYIIVIHTPTIESKDQLQISVAEDDRHLIIEGQFAEFSVEHGKCKQITSSLPSAFVVNVPLPSKIDVTEVVITKVNAGMSILTVKKAKECKRKLLLRSI